MARSLRSLRVGAVSGIVRDGGADQGADLDRGAVCGGQVSTYLAEVTTARGRGFGKDVGLGSIAPDLQVRAPRSVDDREGREFPAYDSLGIQGMVL